MTSSAIDQWRAYFQASLSNKASPYQSRPWVQLSQTLEGRDKITKVVQYFARFLAFYYDSLQSYYETWRKQREGDDSLEAKAYCQYQATRFRKLQKALSEARRAFGLGRSCIEYHKLKETGILQWLHEYMEYWKKSCLVSSQSVLQQAYTIIPKALPLEISFTLGAFRNYVTSIHPAIPSYEQQQHHHPTPLSWKSIAHSTKLASMVAFWAFDNIAFLSNVGFFDTISFSLPFLNKGRKNQNRSHPIGPVAARMANRTFFFSSLLNLFISWKDWKDHQQKSLKDTWQQYQSVQQKLLLSTKESKDVAKATTESGALEETVETQSLQPLPSITTTTTATTTTEKQALNQELEQLKQTWEQVQHHHFTLFLNLLKNSCDVLVFANSTGVDIPMKISGKKMNEGIHSVCGVLSAICGLIQNFPNALVEKEMND